MKLRLILLGLCLIITQSLSAQINPTLSAGLETLTLNKGTIDVKVLTEIIMDKQKELKQEALKRFMLSLFPETNYTTKYYIQNCLHILFNEKNPQVIQQQILELTTNYALAIGVAKVYTFKKGALDNFKSAYNAYEDHSDLYRGRLLYQFNKKKAGEDDLGKLNSSLNEKNDSLANTVKSIKKLQADVIKNPKADSAHNLEKLYKKLKKFERQRKGINDDINLTKLRNNTSYNVQDSARVDSLPFGMLVDVVSAALSNIGPLKTKGFFKDAIDYRSDSFYLRLTSAEDVKFKTALDTLFNDVKGNIEPYITNYEVIKEFFSAKLQDNSTGSIKDKLIAQYVVVIEKIMGDKQFIEIVKQSFNNKNLDKSLDQYKKFFTAITNLETGQKQAKEASIRLSALENYRSNLAILPIKNRDITVSYNSDTAIVHINKSIENILITELDSNNVIQKRLIGYKKAYELNKQQINSIPALYKEQQDSLDKLVPKLHILTQLKISVSPQDTGAIKSYLVKIHEELSTVGDTIQARLVNNAASIIRTGDFFELYLKNMVNQFAQVGDWAIKKTQITESNKASLTSYTDLLARAYQQLNLFSKQQNIALKDINYIDDEVIPQLIKYAVIFPDDADTLKARIANFRLLSQLLKIKAVSGVSRLKEYEPAFIDLFAFISNLDNLDRAETYENMLKLLQDANEKVLKDLDDGKFRDTYTMFVNAVRKYTLINTQQQYVEVDVVSFLTDLQQYFDRNNDTLFGLYLTLGLNQNFFFGKPTLPGSTEPLKYIGFASEKIGLKLRFHSFKRVKGYENTVKNDVNLNKRSPIVNQWYGIIYGSGLLYSIANTSTSTNFNYPHVGVGTGIRFYNALDLNLVVGMPFIKDQSIKKYMFYGFGLDIPLGQYLEKLGSK